MISSKKYNISILILLVVLVLLLILDLLSPRSGIPTELNSTSESDSSLMVEFFSNQSLTSLVDTITVGAIDKALIKVGADPINSFDSTLYAQYRDIILSEQFGGRGAKYVEFQEEYIAACVEQLYTLYDWGGFSIGKLNEIALILGLSHNEGYLSLVEELRNKKIPN